MFNIMLYVRRARCLTLYQSPEIRSYLEHIERETSIYGKISDATAIKLVDSLSTISSDQTLASVLRKFFNVLSGSKSWDFAFFVPYTIDKGLNDTCVANIVSDSKQILIRAFNEAARIPSLNAQNYAYMAVIKGLYSCGLTRIGDNLSRSLTKNVNDISSLERYMYVARAIAVKDFDESDNAFMLIKAKINQIREDLSKAVLLVKLAHHISKTLNDAEGKRIATECLRESLEIKNGSAIDHIKYLSLALPYIFSVDLTLGSKLLDSLLYSVISRRNWVEHCRQFLENCDLVIDSVERILRIENWVHRIYTEKRISKADYYRLIAAARGVIVYLDPFYASAIITSNHSPVAGVSTQSVEASVDIIKSLTRLNISTAYELSSTLMRELIAENRHSEAIELCAELQQYFPMKTREQYDFIILPSLKKLNRSQIIKLLPSLSLLNTSSVVDLIKNLLRSIEKVSNPLTRALEVANIASAIHKGQPTWSKQLLLYAEELVEGYDWEKKADVIEIIIETLIKIDERVGLKKFQKLISSIAETNPKVATRIIERLMPHLKYHETRTITKQLLQYATENKKNDVKD